MAEGCRCGHEKHKHRRSHRRGESDRWVCDAWKVPPARPRPGDFIDPRTGVECDCTRYDDSRLPVEGERLEFGVHRLASRDSEAEAWPVGEARISARIRRAVGLEPVRRG